MAKLLAHVSGHGLGHWGQTAPVLNALMAEQLDLELVVRSAIAPSHIQGRLDRSCEIVPCRSDIGLKMTSAIHVLSAQSHEVYREEWQNWSTLVDADCRELERIQPDLVLSNVGYRILAAAHRVGIPSLAMSSLNWADIYWAYAKELPSAGDIRQNLIDCYNRAQAFLALTPAIAMPMVDNVIEIGPVANLSKVNNARARLNAAPDEKLVLVAMGGIPTKLDISTWPKLANIRWVLPPELAVQLTASTPYQILPWPDDLTLTDVLSCCDAVITKLGYGTLLECACHGVPALYADRPDWPENEPMNRWLDDHAVAERIEWERLVRGDFEDVLNQLLSCDRRQKLMPSGIEQAVKEIVQVLPIEPDAERH